MNLLLAFGGAGVSTLVWYAGQSSIINYQMQLDTGFISGIVYYTYLLFSLFCLLNIGLAVFNLIPIPPLDGFHVFNDILLRGKIRLTSRAFQICMVAMLVLMNATDFFSNIVSKGIDLVQNGVLTVIMRLFGLS